MPQYRFYSLDRLGYIVGTPQFAEFENDDDAIALGRQIVGSEPLEIWQDVRQVAIIQPSEKNTD